MFDCDPLVLLTSFPSLDVFLSTQVLRSGFHASSLLAESFFYTVPFELKVRPRYSGLLFWMKFYEFLSQSRLLFLMRKGYSFPNFFLPVLALRMMQFALGFPMVQSDLYSAPCFTFLHEFLFMMPLLAILFMTDGFLVHPGSLFRYHFCCFDSLAPAPQSLVLAF